MVEGNVLTEMRKTHDRKIEIIIEELDMRIEAWISMEDNDPMILERIRVLSTWRDSLKYTS